MRLSNTIQSFLIALFASGLAACTVDVRKETREESALGAPAGDGKAAGDVGTGGNELPSGCLQGTVESTTCEDPGILKDQAFAICQANGLTFTVFDYEGGDCGWQTTQAHYECCPQPPTPPVVDPPPPIDPPPPPEPPAICASGSIGDGITCQSLDVLKLAAIEACDQAGLQLFDLLIEVDCGPGEAAKMTYSCTAVDGVCP